jgi:hypothetical protein
MTTQATTVAMQFLPVAGRVAGLSRSVACMQKWFQGGGWLDNLQLDPECVLTDDCAQLPVAGHQCSWPLVAG